MELNDAVNAAMAEARAKFSWPNTWEPLVEFCWEDGQLTSYNCQGAEYSLNGNEQNFLDDRITELMRVK